MANDKYIKDTFKPDKLWACPSFTGSKFPGVVSPNTEITNLLGAGVKLAITRGNYKSVKAVNENLLGQPGTYIINNDKICMYAGIIDGRHYFTNTTLYTGTDLSNPWADDLRMDGLFINVRIGSYPDGHKEKYYDIYSKDFHYDTPAYTQTIRNIVNNALVNKANYTNSVIVIYKLRDREISYTITSSEIIRDIDLSLSTIIDNENDNSLILTPIITVKTNDERTQLYYYSYLYSSLSYDSNGGSGKIYHINNLIPFSSTATTPVTIDFNENDMTAPIEYIWTDYTM